MLTPVKSGRYLSILADGRLHETVPQTREGAVLREYETSDGKKGEKWELVYSAVKATITGISFQTGEYGEQVQLALTDGEDEITLSQGCATPFGEDILKKLPNVDLTKEVIIRPFAFEGDDGKTIRGVEIKQGDKKLSNYFWDAESKKALHGYPESDGNKDDKDDWKIHFLKARKFLVNYVKENVKVAQRATEPVEYPSLDSSEVPF